jgi:hypothetical protein
LASRHESLFMTAHRISRKRRRHRAAQPSVELQAAIEVEDLAGDETG